MYGCINLHYCIECPESDSRTVGSWHPPYSGRYQDPLQSGESLRETRKLRWGWKLRVWANVDGGGFPRFFWSCFCHLWLFVSICFVKWIEDVLHLSWEALGKSFKTGFFLNAAEPLDDWELMSRDSLGMWWRQLVKRTFPWYTRLFTPNNDVDVGVQGSLTSWRIFQMAPTFCWRLEEINIQHVESMTKSELCFRRYCLFTSLRGVFFQFRFAKRVLHQPKPICNDHSPTFWGQSAQTHYAEDAFFSTPIILWHYDFYRKK